MSGVKGLMARFESANLAAASTPPERGRSPAESLGAGSNGTSPRPLSKVRTSFVTVESKSGQIGLRRDTSGEPSTSQRRTSFSIDEEVKKPVLDRKQSYNEELQARKDSKITADTIPEVAGEMEEPQEPVTRGREPVKRREVVKPKEDVKPKEAVKPKEEVKVPAVVTKEPSNTNGASKSGAAKEPVKASSSRPTTRPTPISTAKTMVAPKPSPKKAKSPLPKTPTTPKALHTTNVAEKQPENKASRASSASMQTKTPTKPTTTAAHGSAFKTRIGASPPQTGFVKPKPRSPTRPIKLPASLTAHTASSGSKTAVVPAQRTESRGGFSRASAHPPQVTNSLRTQQTQNRSPSRVSTTSTKTAVPVRNPSRLGRTTASRSSIGPPPTSQLKKQTSRQSLPAAADEGFLARMMRSTASSASKTAEKGPVTPPKVTQPVKKSVAKHDPPKISLPTREKKAVAKAGPSIAKAKEAVGEAAKSVKSAVKAPLEGKKETPVKKTAAPKKVSKESAAPIAEPAPLESTSVVKEDVPITEEKTTPVPSQDEKVLEPETAPKEKEADTPVEPEVESEPEFTPAESVEENISTGITTAEEPISETKEIEEEASITAPVTEAKEESSITTFEPTIQAKQAEEEELDATIESDKEEEEEEVIPTPATETTSTSPTPSEPTIAIPNTDSTPEVLDVEISTVEESPVEAVPAVEVATTEAKSPVPSTLNFFGEHANMWGRKTEEKPVLKSSVSEDAEDIKAREEIAALNKALLEEGGSGKGEDDVE